MHILKSNLTCWFVHGVLFLSSLSFASFVSSASIDIRHYPNSDFKREMYWFLTKQEKFVFVRVVCWVNGGHVIYIQRMWHPTLEMTLVRNCFDSMTTSWLYLSIWGNRREANIAKNSMEMEGSITKTWCRRQTEEPNDTPHSTHWTKHAQTENANGGGGNAKTVIEHTKIIV